MMNLNIYAENLGKKDIIIFVSIDLKRQIKEDIVFKMNAKTRIQNAFQIMASGISTIFSPEISKEPFDKSKILLQEKQAGNHSNLFDRQIVAIVDKLLEYKYISTK